MEVEIEQSLVCQYHAAAIGSVDIEYFICETHLSHSGQVHESYARVYPCHSVSDYILYTVSALSNNPLP